MPRPASPFRGLPFLAAAALGWAAGGPAPPEPPAWIWGLTTDDPRVDTGAQAAALRAFPFRPVVRVVFDLPAGGHPAARDYALSVATLAASAALMGLPVDSSVLARLDLPGVRSRIAEYLEALGPWIPLWEVGNEVNGDWVGPGAAAKVEAMFDAVKAAGRQAALTLYFEHHPAPGHGLLDWVDTHLPPGHRMRRGLDLVLVSHYEDQDGGRPLRRAELQTLFAALADRFPNARLGLGESGWGGAIPVSAATRAALIRRVYGHRLPSIPAYAGGGFFWHFRQTMVPRTAPDWRVLASLGTSGP